MRTDESLQLRERSAHLALLARISQQLVLADGTDERTLQTILEQLASVQGYEFFLHFQLDEDGRTLRLAASGGLTVDERARYATLPIGEQLCGAVADHRQPIVAEELPHSPYSTAASWYPEGLRCYVGFPLLAQGVLFGTVAFATCRRAHLHEGELQLIQTVCDQAAVYIARVNGVRRLRDRETHLQLAMRASLAIAFEWDILRDQVRRFASLDGALPEPADACDTFEDVARAVHPEDRARFRANALAATASPTGLYESTFRVVRPDGTVRWLSESGRVEHDARGRPTRLIGISQDVSDRRATADELLAQEDFTRRITDVAPSMLYVFDLDEYRNIWGNREMQVVLGYTRDEVEAMGHQMLDLLLHPDDTPRYLQHAEGLLTLADDEVAEFDYRMRHADGSWRWLHSREMVFRRASDGRARQIVGSALDVTERHEEEQQLTFLAELNDAFAPVRRSDEIARIAADRIARQFGTARVTLSDVNPADRTVTTFFSRSAVGDTGDRTVHRLDEHPGVQATGELSSGCEVAVVDVSADERTAARAAVYEAAGTRALLLAPVVRDGRWLFLIELHAPHARAWHRHEITLLHEVAARVYGRLERERVEEALLGAHATFRHLVEQSPFGVYVVDADFRLVQVSAGAQKVFANVRPLLGRDFATVMRLIWPAPFAADVIGRFRHTLATGDPYHAPSTVERRSDIGVVESYDWKIERITLPDGRPGVVCHFYDLSNRQRYEEALRSADRQKDEFLAMLAHELRNPLAPIRASVGVMRSRGPADAVLVRCRDIIERQAAHMARLLDDLLDVSRLSRGRLTLQRAPTLLRDALDAAVETSRPLIDQQKQTLHLEMRNEGLLVDGDSARLTQVFANLLNNAAKYSEPGGRIDLLVSEREARVDVRVRDTGIGIAPDMLDRVFDLFAQDGEAKAHAPGGLGIGLSLARKLAEMHGGTLGVTSMGPGRGSEFTVTLPVMEALGADAPAATAQAPAIAPARSCRVLVADDNADAADTTAMLLEAFGCEVRTVYGGEAAVQGAEEFRPDVVLLDLGMPEVDGYEACRRIRRRPWSAGVVLVAVSGWGQNTDRQQSAGAGFDRHLLKPVEPDVFVQLIRETRWTDRAG